MPWVAADNRALSRDGHGVNKGETTMVVLTAGAPPRGSLRYQLESGLAELTPAERAERGKAARVAVPRDSHAEFDPAAGPARPARAAGGAGQGAGAGAGPGAVGPDDGLPVHLLPRRGAADGQRPGHHPGIRAGGAGVRGRAPVELRRLRLGRAAPGLRRQRLRRDAARPVGMGRQAAGRQHGGSGPRQRLRRQGPPCDRRRHSRPVTGRRCGPSPG